METPCINICLMDPATDLCAGCGRTLDEIGNWMNLSDAERARILAELPERMKKLKPD